MIKLKGGSFAQTYRLTNSIIRKIVSKKKDPIRGSLVIEGQYKWLNFAKESGLNVPDTIKFEDNKKNSFYEMENINNAKLFAECQSLAQSEKIFKKIVKNLKKFYDKNRRDSKKNDNLLVDLIHKKAIPSIQLLKKSKEGTIYFNQKYFLINNVKCENINSIFKNLHKKENKFLLRLSKNFDTAYKTVIHGDLTLENIIYKKNNFYFIDPLGGFMDINFTGNFLHKASPLFDFGKLSQSIIGGYETWKDFDSLESIKSNKFEFKIKMPNKKDFEKFNYLKKNFQYLTKDFEKVVIMHMIIILCRIIRYRIDNNFYSSILCFLVATFWINIIKNKINENLF
jgi:aminoglycoside phosphotransferase